MKKIILIILSLGLSLSVSAGSLNLEKTNCDKDLEKTNCDKELIEVNVNRKKVKDLKERNETLKGHIRTYQDDIRFFKKLLKLDVKTREFLLGVLDPASPDFDKYPGWLIDQNIREMRRNTSEMGKTRRKMEEAEEGIREAREEIRANKCVIGT